MKKQQKNNRTDNNTLTKEYLDKKLSNFATKDDLKNFATKDDLKKLRADIKFIELDLKQQIKGTEHYLDHRVNTIEKKIDGFVNDFDKLKDWMYDKLDWLVVKYKKFDEEHTVLSSGYSKINEKIENHEGRIAVLEKKAPYQ